MSEAIPRKHLQSSTIRRTTSKREINDEDLVKIGETKVLEIDFDAFFSYMMKSTKEAGAKVESFAQPLHFLHSCGACRCPLGSEHDIFIYRYEFHEIYFKMNKIKIRGCYTHTIYTYIAYN